jgi:antitoxin VapB
MTAMRASVFKNNQSQAIRLPKNLAFEDSVKSVMVTAIGKTRLIAPIENTWDDWFARKGASEDFMVERNQEPDGLRESL